MNVITKKKLTGIFAAFVFALMAVLTPVVPAHAEAVDCTGVSGGLKGGIDCANPGATNVPQNLFTGDKNVFTTVVNALLYLIGAISVIMLIYGGIRYTISGGNSANVTAAKNTILYAIIGLIVAILAYAIVNFVLKTVISNA